MADSVTLVSIQVGLPQLLNNGHGPTWSSAICKQRVVSPIWLDTSNLEGDAQADLSVHGGPDKAVLAYSAEHYPAWRDELQLRDFEYGAFGENFTIAMQAENTVCVGDIYDIGEAKVEVSQPRSPCWKLARKWNLPHLPARVVASGRSGWYFRVLREGKVAPGIAVELRKRTYPQWSIQTTATIAYDIESNREAAIELCECPALAQSWRHWIAQRLRR